MQGRSDKAAVPPQAVNLSGFFFFCVQWTLACIQAKIRRKEREKKIQGAI